jgi:protein-L-isoaspartate O-methyltransferase
MYQNLSPDEIAKVQDFIKIRQRNNDFCWMLCDYLNNNPGFITKELMESVNSDNALPEETVYFALLTGLFDLDTENNKQDNQLANDYLRQAVKMLNTKLYLENPYYQNILIPEVKFGHWELKYQKYEPYEAFIYKDLVVKPDFKEFPCIGFFNETFRFPSVMENAHEWMSIKPSEIETTQPAIDAIEGNVVTFGLGLGYFTYMASLKESVKNVTVIEHDNEVIQLFERYLLPQFQNKEKVKIISADAFEYAEKQMYKRNFDYAFVDLWHDVSDGLAMYLRMKKTEHFNPSTKFLYWIEDSLLSGFRWQIFDWIIENAQSYYEIVECLNNSVLKKLAATDFRILQAQH